MIPLLIGAGVAGLLYYATRNKGYFSPNGQRIYLLGDSLSVGAGSPGGQLANLLRNAGAAVEVESTGGWTAYQYLHQRREEILSDVSTFQPSRVLIFLGTNDYANVAAGGNSNAMVKAQAELKQLFRVPVYYIGPPQVDASVVRGRPLVDLLPWWYEQLKAIYGQNLIDTRSFAKPMQGNVHLNASNAKLFASQVFATLTGEHPPTTPLKGKQRVLQWLPIAREASAQYGVPVSIILGTIEHESGGNKDAVGYSKTGVAQGRGLMQLLPTTAEQYKVDYRDPRANIFGGTHLLSDLYKRYSGDWRPALAAYFAGPGNVKKRGWEHFGAYVQKTLDMSKKYEGL